MASESLHVEVIKRKGEDRRIVLKMHCTRDRDGGGDGIEMFHEWFDPDEDKKRVKDSPDFKKIMKAIEDRVARLICMQLY